VPGAVADFAPIEKLAERAVAGTEKHDAYRWFLLVKSMAEYRAGHDAEAMNWLARFTPRSDGFHADASAFALLAMAQHRLSKTPAAQEALDKAKSIIAKKLPDPTKGHPFRSGDFQEWIFCQVLCREAEGLLGGTREGGVNKPLPATQPTPATRPATSG
jgi:hypothetical protein